jgi:hypothetical protein
MFLLVFKFRESISCPFQMSGLFQLARNVCFILLVVSWNRASSVISGKWAKTHEDNNANGVRTINGFQRVRDAVSR